MIRGRFAPSPTGPLHFGSLIAAVGSYLENRCHDGQWLIRMEDLDPPREQPGAADNILRTLDGFGFEWDGEVIYQSRRHQAYNEVLAKLTESGQLYPCTCSRKEIGEQGKSNAFGVVYPGTCRDPLKRDKNKDAALRLRTDNKKIVFSDAIQGEYSQQLETEIGDFLLKRRDGYFAYHLAVVVDDAEQGITHIVRGCDLLDSTPRQIYLQQLLNVPTPSYTHLPVAVNQAGQKLSKQTQAKAIDRKQASLLLWQVLDFLGQQPDIELKHETLPTIWNWAFTHWQLSKVPQVKTMIWSD
ncbi:MAG: tRNA glutamyl-Q(34) synthetase GluQRS [Gammaproteobacteria bacterium]|nr:tRNA glutamyl-Q(34) synthetase GluQRS [Gammaproteobacteria bacterium]